VKESKKRSRGTPTRPQNSSAEEKLIAMLERQVADLQRANAKLLRMVELVMEERFYRPTVTGGVRENLQTSAVPLESLNDVATFDEEADEAHSRQQATDLRALEDELRAVETEHLDWRAQKGIAREEATTAA
jgi:hypothetical protein